MNKFIVGIDLDGTLLNDQKKISIHDIEYLRKIEKRGHTIVLASGRSPNSVSYYQKIVGLKSPIISFNGGYIFSNCDEKFRYTKKNALPLSTILPLYHELVDKNILYNVVFEDVKEVYTDQIVASQNEYLYLKDQILIPGKIDEILTSDPLTMIIEYIDGCDQKDISEIISKYDDLSARFWPDTRFVEIHRKSNDKGIAFKKLGHDLGFDDKHIIGFGDWINDLSLIKNCGISVCMCNGCDEVKKNATIISLTDNNHSGVSKTLRTILNKKF